MARGGARVGQFAPPRIDVYVHVESSSSNVERKLDQVLTGLNAVLKLEGKLMTKSDDIQGDVNSLSAALDVATNEIAKDLEELRRQIAAGLEGGLTADQAAELQASLAAKFGPIRDRLVELGKDPADPIPATT